MKKFHSHAHKRADVSECVPFIIWNYFFSTVESFDALKCKAHFIQCTHCRCWLPFAMMINTTIWTGFLSSDTKKKVFSLALVVKMQIRINWRLDKSCNIPWELFTQLNFYSNNTCEHARKCTPFIIILVRLCVLILLAIGSVSCLKNPFASLSQFYLSLHFYPIIISNITLTKINRELIEMNKVQRCFVFATTSVRTLNETSDSTHAKFLKCPQKINSVAFFAWTL